MRAKGRGLPLVAFVPPVVPVAVAPEGRRLEGLRWRGDGCRRGRRRRGGRGARHLQDVDDVLVLPRADAAAVEQDACERQCLLRRGLPSRSGACAAVPCRALASAPSPGSPPSASEVASVVMAEPSVSVGGGSGRVSAWVRPWCFAAGAPGPVGWVPLHSTAKSVTARARTRTAATMTRRRRARARRFRGCGAVENGGTGHPGGRPTGCPDCSRDRALCTRDLWRGTGPAGPGPQRLPHLVRRREAVPWVRGHGATRDVAQRGRKPLQRGRSGTEALSR